MKLIQDWRGGIAGIGSLTLATFGVTAATFASSAGSLIYLLVVGGSFALAAVYIIKHRLFLTKSFATVTAICVAFIILMLIHFAAFYRGDGAAFPFSRYVAIPLMLYIVYMSGRLNEASFEFAMIVIAIMHALLIVYALLSGTYMGESRFSTDEFTTAAWAEIAAGTAIASVLSKRTWLTVTIVVLCGYIMVITQMRTTALVIVCVVALQLLLPAVIGGRSWRKALAVASLVVVVVIAVTSLDVIILRVSELLLLDDPYRGISSGLSGRGDNILAGWEKFLESPVFGYGFIDDTVLGTHNGYVLFLAQFGAPMAVVFGILATRSVILSLRAGDTVLCACVVSLLVYYMGQPRNINFQIMPLAGIFAVARALSLSTRRAVRSHRLLTVVPWGFTSRHG